MYRFKVFKCVEWGSNTWCLAILLVIRTHSWPRWSKFLRSKKHSTTTFYRTKQEKKEKEKKHKKSNNRSHERKKKVVKTFIIIIKIIIIIIITIIIIIIIYIALFLQRIQQRFTKIVKRFLSLTKIWKRTFRLKITITFSVSSNGVQM